MSIEKLAKKKTKTNKQNKNKKKKTRGRKHATEIYAVNFLSTLFS